MPGMHRQTAVATRGSELRCRARAARIGQRDIDTGGILPDQQKALFVVSRNCRFVTFALAKAEFPEGLRSPVRNARWQPGTPLRLSSQTRPTMSPASARLLRPEASR
jgi:hypothetical protein